MWPRKRPTKREPEGVVEAREMRNEANRELARIRQQDLYVSRLTARLVERRELDPFGEDIEITFTRRHA